MPKLIPRLHAEYWYNARAYAAFLGWSADDRVGHLIPIIHNAGIVCGVHAPHSVGACLVLTDHDLETAMPVLVAERTTVVLFGHVHYRAPEHPLYPALAESLRTVVLSGAKVSEELFAATGRDGVAVGQLFGMAEGMFLVTPLDASPELRRTTVGTPISPLDEVRVLEPGSRGRGPRRRGRRAVLPGPVHAARLLRRPNVRRPSPPTASTARATSRRPPRSTGSARSRSRAASRTSSTAAARRSTPRRSSCCCSPIRTSSRRPSSPCPTRGSGNGAAPTSPPTARAVTLEDLRDHLRTLDVAKFKWPERVELLEALPRTKVGKLDKKAMAADITARLEAS